MVDVSGAQPQATRPDTQSGAFAGLRVIDCTDYIAGPYAGMMLADMGADVIKVEPLDGDRWRQQAPAVPGESRGFLSVNRGKRGMAVNLREPEGLAVLLRLLDTADVLVVNFRPGVAERLGLGYDELAARNPRLIYAENTAFGTVGPDRNRPGFDLLSQAAAGVMDYEHKVQDGILHGITTSAIGDVTAGMFLAYAVAGALYVRSMTGCGQRVSTSLFAAAIAVQYRPLISIERFDGGPRAAFLEALAHARLGATYEQICDLREEVFPGSRNAASSGNNYYRSYETRDGMVAVACLNNRFRRRLRDLLEFDDPSVEGDAYDWNAPGFHALHNRLRGQFESAFRSSTNADWLERLDAADIPCAPVRLTQEIFDEPQVAATGMMLTLDHPTLGLIRQPAGPIRMSESPYGMRRPAPILGQDTNDILLAAGYGSGEIAALRERRIIR